MKNFWIISDTHFNHVNILNFTDKDGKTFRNFSDVTEMNERMIENWNKVVKPQDHVYHLGDVYFGSQQAADKILSRLMGKKRLILGNHDNGKDSVLLKHFEKIMLWRIWRDEQLMFTHIPVHESNIKVGMHKNAEGDGERSIVNFTNIHGHIHQNDSPKGPYRNVCVDYKGNDYRPINIDELR